MRVNTRAARFSKYRATEGVEPMSESKHSHPKHDELNPDSVEQRQLPYWKRAHRDWRFWIALILMFAAIIIYVMSDNLALLPCRPPHRDLPGAVEKL